MEIVMRTKEYFYYFHQTNLIDIFSIYLVDEINYYEHKFYEF